MNKLQGALCIALALGGCSTGTLDVVMQHDGIVSVKPSETNHDEWIVTALPAKYVGYDHENQSNRHSAALRIVSKQCASPKVVSERSLIRGGPLGGSTRTYYITVRC